MGALTGRRKVAALADASSLEPRPDGAGMLLIPCPWCGPRNQVEFTYGGDATVKRPACDASEAEWLEYVYIRDNPCGPHDELWLHSAGCRRWFQVRRDSRTHDILASARLGEPLPEPAP